MEVRENKTTIEVVDVLCGLPLATLRRRKRCDVAAVTARRAEVLAVVVGVLLATMVHPSPTVCRTANAAAASARKTFLSRICTIFLA